MGGGASRRRVCRGAVVLALLAGCSERGTTTVVRGADEVQVMSPQEVLEQRLPMVTATTVGPDTGSSDTGAPNDSGPGDTGPTDSAAPDTIPLNQDDRPPEVRLFAAFGAFRGCLEDQGYAIEGNLLDPNNQAMQDPAYRDTVITCAARTDIVNILQEVQATRANLTPEQVEQRNAVFVELRDCLRDKGWTVEATASEIGLLEPTVLQNAEGVLDEREINQCLSEINLGA